MTDKYEDQAAKRPHNLRDGPLKASIWENQRESGMEYTVDFTRSYRDAESGEWREARSFRRQHLSQLKALCERAFLHIEEQRRGRSRDRESYIEQQQQVRPPERGRYPNRSR